MRIDDASGADLDSERERLLVVINATPGAADQTVAALVGEQLSLHPVQAGGSDDVVKTTTRDAGVSGQPDATHESPGAATEHADPGQTLDPSYHPGDYRSGPTAEPPMTDRAPFRQSGDAGRRDRATPCPGSCRSSAEHRSGATAASG